MPAAAATAPRGSFFYDTAADETQWGDLKLRLVYDGEWPKPNKIIPDRGGGPVLDSEKLIVNAKDFGIANLAMWLYRASDQPPLAVHPSYAKAADATVELKTTGRTFVPHVVVARTKQKLKFSNPDALSYNVKVEFFRNQSFNNLLRPGGEFGYAFSHQETMPAKVEDSIHSWMYAYLIVRDDPYAAISDTSGNVKIARLPVGKWTFVVWQESAGYVKEATLGGEKVKWERGRVTLDIKSGDNNLGELKLAPDVFKK